MDAPIVVDSVTLRATAASQFQRPHDGQAAVQLVVESASEEGIAVSLTTNIGFGMPSSDVKAAVAHLLHRLAHVIAEGASIELSTSAPGDAA
jgi:hypothetical protein